VKPFPLRILRARRVLGSSAAYALQGFLLARTCAPHFLVSFNNGYGLFCGCRPSGLDRAGFAMSRFPSAHGTGDGTMDIGENGSPIKTK